MIGGWLERLPSFGEKVVWLLTFIGGLAVLLVCAGLVLFAYFDLRSEFISSIESQTRLVAMNSGAPLAFNDAASGREALATMRVAPNIASATVFDLRGTRFAEVRRRDDPAPQRELDSQLGLHRDDGWTVLTVPVDDVGQRLGFVQVVFDFDALHKRMWAMLGAVFAVAMAATLVIHLVARGLRGVLVRPVAELARTAREISQTRNYDVRARRTSADEIGQFTDAFNEMLAQIQKQHAEVQMARGEAERASQMKDEFLATLSHELRTPMTPILGWSQIMLRSVDDPGRVRQGAEIIERNARIQTQIIDDLLDMSRIVSGKLMIQMRTLDLRAVVESALATVQSTALARGVVLLSQIEPELPLVCGDPNRLQQVIWNLLTNAIKFTPRGGRVWLRLRREQSRVRLSVVDEGQGIEPDFLPHVFERFRQADSSTTRAHGGLGLGLAIVKQLVEQHGGSVGASSDGHGQGACFSVELPIPAVAMPATTDAVSAAPEPAIASLEVTRDTPLRGMTVLVVDDDADARELMARLLFDAGAMVATAASAEEAMRLLPLRRPDMLLTDIGMPGCDGYELLERVRQLPADRGGATPAIALTAFARTEDRVRALRAGFQHHLGKPVDANQLVATIATLRPAQPRDVAERTG